MSKEEFLRGLEEALAGEVPESVIRENMNYYNSYISQEMAKGRSVDEIADEIGEPRIVARTIIDSCEAAGETGSGYGSYEDAGYSGSQSREPGKIHYLDLSKWYWKLLTVAVLLLVVTVVFQVVGGIFVLLMRFAGPVFLALMVFWFIKGTKQ